MAARGEDDRVRLDEVAPSAREVEAVRPEDGPVMHQQPGDVDAFEDGDVELLGASDQRALDLQPGVVAGERGPPELVRPEEPLGDTAVVFPGEERKVSLVDHYRCRFVLRETSTVSLRLLSNRKT